MKKKIYLDDDEKSLAESLENENGSPIWLKKKKRNMRQPPVIV